jgi:hypothetical protein
MTVCLMSSRQEHHGWNDAIQARERVPVAATDRCCGVNRGEPESVDRAVATSSPNASIEQSPHLHTLSRSFRCAESCRRLFKQHRPTFDVPCRELRAGHLVACVPPRCDGKTACGSHGIRMNSILMRRRPSSHNVASSLVLPHLSTLHRIWSSQSAQMMVSIPLSLARSKWCRAVCPRSVIDD